MRQPRDPSEHRATSSPGLEGRQGYLEAMGWVYSVSTRTMVDLPSRSQGHGREATGGMPPSQRERERMPWLLPSSHPPSPTGSPTGQARSQFVGVSPLLYKVDH